jgi:hypothetical protein
MENHAMSLIRNGNAVSPRRRFLGLFFFAVLALVLFVPRAATAQEAKQIKLEIAALKADRSVPEADKKEGLAQLEAALKVAKPIQFKENIALVLKYYDQLAPFMQELRPAD